MPVDREIQARREPFGIQTQRLATVENGGHNVGGQIGQRDQTGQVGSVNSFLAGKSGKAGVWIFQETTLDLMSFDQQGDQNGIDAAFELAAIGSLDQQSHLLANPLQPSGCRQQMCQSRIVI